MIASSTPSITQFDPGKIPFQLKVIKDIRKNFKYDSGPHEMLLSGSVGSAKSLLVAHIAVTHCLFNKKARFLLGRQAMPDLRDTLIQKVLEHIEPDMREGKDYFYNATRGAFRFTNGSELISRSWHDKRYSKLRSLELSGAAIEELTENSDREFYDELRARVGRLPHIKENIIICATNPGSPAHWAHDYFIKSTNPRIHVYYSRTSDNPFLPSWYIDSLRETYDAKMCERLLEGIWNYIDSESIYYEYKREKHYTLENSKVDVRYPIRLTFDFNIGMGKPFSSLVFQFIEHTKQFVFLDEVVIEGTRTLNNLEEIANRGWLDVETNPPIIVHGDATGRASDTRSPRSDYDIIEKFLDNFMRKDKDYLKVEIDVPRSNPRLRDRHNKVNGQLCNSSGKSFILIDKRCKTLDEGLSKTKLKKNAGYVEDDSKSYQHVTTAMGYGICSVLNGIGPIQPIEMR